MTYFRRKVQQQQLSEAQRQLPAEDFVNGTYDHCFHNPARELLVIVSTQRSGSTLLCSYLYRQGVCLAHEYFQPFQYMPILSIRWGALQDKRINMDIYCQQLIKYRTLSNGILGINLHGNHLALFEQAADYFSGLKQNYLFLQRRNILGQAISYEIASQTKCWSSHFDHGRAPRYSYQGVLNKIRKIQQQNLAAEIFFAKIGIRPTYLYYEDFVLSPTAALGKEMATRFDLSDQLPVAMKQQDNEVNHAWKKRFIHDFDAAPKVQNYKLGVAKKILGYLRRLSRQ